MAHPVTPLPVYWPADAAPPDTNYTEPEGWAGLPADLLYRVLGLLDIQYELPCLLATCRSWHRTLKSALVSLRIHRLGLPALGIKFASVRNLDAPLRRRTPLGLAYLAPIGNVEALRARFPSLVQLNLSGQDFVPRGLAVLRPLAGRLRHLDCSGCKFGRADIAALAHLSHLTSLALNAIRAAPVDEDTHPEDQLARDFVFDVVPRLLRLRRLGLRQGAELSRNQADLARHRDTLQQLQQQHQQAIAAGEFALEHTDLQRAADALYKSRRRFLGLPIRTLVDSLTILRDLSSLDLSQQSLDTADLAALAALTGLTALAMTWPFLPAPLPIRPGPWPPKPDPAVVWASLFGGPMGQSLRVLDVDLDNRDEHDRLSLATLRNLRVLRLRNCNTPHLLISLMRPQATGLAAGPAVAGSHGGSGGRGAGAGGSGGGGGDGGGDGGGGLVRLELLRAGKRITPALVSQVCSCLPGLCTLDVSGSFRSPASFQLLGDLLVRDLAVLCPWLVQLSLRGVSLHGVGFPDGRDLALLPFLGPETEPAVDRAATAEAFAAAGPSGAAGGAATRSASAAAAASTSTSPSASASSPELVQLPFPRLRSLVVQGGAAAEGGVAAIQRGPVVFLKSKFRSLANLRALRQLRIEGMSEKDFLASCKMGCYEHLSRLTALTALHITPPPPPAPPAPPPWEPFDLAQEPQAPAAAAAAAVVVPPLPLPIAAAGPVPGAGAAGGGGGWAAAAGPSAAGRAASLPPPRPEPHLNFITQITTLRVLTLQSLTTRGRVFSYLAQLPHLRALSLGGCIDWSEDGLGCLRMSHMPQLRSLCLLGCVWQQGAADAWRLVSCLPRTAPSLEELELGACPGVTAQRLATLLGPQPSTSASAAASGAAAGSRDGPVGQSSGLPRLRYMRLYGAPIDPAAVQHQQAALAAGSLRMLDLVSSTTTTTTTTTTTSPSGGSFCMVRSETGFEAVAPEVEAGAGGGGGRWRNGRQRDGGGGGGMEEESAEDWDWDLQVLPVWENGDALF